MRKKKSGPKSMRGRMVFIMLICWMIPFSLLIGVFGVYVAGNHGSSTAQSYSDQLYFNSKIAMERLNMAVFSSRQASYDGDILEAYDQHQGGEISDMAASRLYKSYLSSKYQKNDAVACAVLFMNSDPDMLYMVYNSYGNGSYQLTKSYENQYHQTIKEYAASLGTKVGFLYRGDNLYLIRNLVDSHFEQKGTLVLGLNMSYCFETLQDYPLADGIYIRLNTQIIAMTEGGSLEEMIKGEEIPQNSYLWKEGRLFLSNHLNGNSYSLDTAMLMDGRITKYPFYGYQYLLGAMLISLIPMLLMMLHAFRKQVTKPVKILSDGAGKIQNGEIGYQITEKLENAELTYLKNSMNAMSFNLKKQFDHIYEEEVALREARIMALQAHINPHFMNNTLEIINWEARLGGNEKVSNMIGSLSVLLDAAMDRKKKPQVSLREEMTYVNAYLFIMKERLGNKLSMEIDVPEELMDYQVPRLILQPVIENAIEHGVIAHGSGTVKLQAEKDAEYLYLKVFNSGKISEEDRKRMDRLLDPGYIAAKEPSGNLGIANVNQRLRILFGEPCGLKITESADQRVMAILTIPLQNEMNQHTEEGSIK